MCTRLKGLLVLSALLLLAVSTFCSCVDPPRDNPGDPGGSAYSEWHGTLIVDSTGDVGVYTSIALSGDTVYITYSDNSQTVLKCARSYDRGETWPAENITIIDSSTTPRDSSVAASGDSVYVSYYDSGDDDLCFARSDDRGETWPAADLAIIDSVGTSTATNSISLSGDSVFIAYCNTDGYDLKLAASLNNGTDWLSENILTIDTDAGVGPCLVSDGDVFYITYNTGSFIACAKSTDSGVTWPAGQIYTVTATDNSANWYPSIAVNGTTLYMSYYYYDNASLYRDLMFAKSTDSGETWSVLTIDSADQVGEYSSLAAEGDHICISYYNRTRGDLKCAISDDGGATWTKVTVDATGDVGMYTDIAMDGDTVYISYRDNSDGNLKFARSVDGGLTW